MAEQAEAPEGLLFVPELVSPDEERALLAAIDALPFEKVRLRGVTARRTVVHYGWGYAYDARTLAPAAPVPGFLEPLRARAAALAGLRPEELAEVLVTRYPPGAGIGWHRDAPMFGPTVVGVSLGAASVMRLRRPLPGGGWQRHALPLPPRSAYVLAGAARSAWQHSLPPGPALRHSITFRTLRPRVRRA